MSTLLVSVTSPTSCDIQNIAMRAAITAGDVLLGCRQLDLVVDRQYAHDIKLEADRLSEEAILRVIRSVMPDASIMAEESGESLNEGEYVWIIDPLDGTLNYYHRQHHFCICVACYRKNTLPEETDVDRLGTPVAGVVYAPSYKEIFTTTKEAVATCNGQPIRTSDVTDLSKAIVTTSFASRSETTERMEGVIHELVKYTQKVRIQGSCGLDICGVAAGRLSALYQSDVRSWDFAAARIILEAAGGKMEAVETAPGRWNILACAPGIFAELQSLVNAR